MCLRRTQGGRWCARNCAGQFAVGGNAAARLQATGYEGIAAGLFAAPRQGEPCPAW